MTAPCRCTNADDVCPFRGPDGGPQCEEPASRTAPSVQDVLDTLNRARRQIMGMYGGNLDHPALDHIETAMGAVVATDLEVRSDG